jgi:TolB-like protein
MSLFTELKRRNVFRVGIAYLVATWLLLQVVDVTSPILKLPDWVPGFIFLVLAIGFIPALIFAWVYELTPEGVKKESEVDRTRSITRHTAQKLDYVTIGLLVITIGFVALDRYLPEATPTTSESTVIPALKGSDPISSTESQAEQSIAVEKLDPTLLKEQSIAVLPFVNMSPDPDQEFFSDGLSEELLNQLANLKGLRVTSRTSAFAFKGQTLPLRDIAAQLRVNHILEGSVRKAGNQVRITAQLIDVASDSHLWSDTFDRQLENIFEIQSEIAQAIAQALHITLAGESPGSELAGAAPTENLEAWQLFLRGRHFYQLRGEHLAPAIELFERAVALDHGFANAWAHLGAAYSVSQSFTDRSSPESAAKGFAAIDRALELDPGNGLALGVRGLHHSDSLEWEQAQTQLDLAVSLNPNESNLLLWKGVVLMELGYVTEALEYLKRAELLDPVFANVHNWLSDVYSSTGNYEKLQEHANRSFELGDTSGLEYLSEYWMAQGDHEQAERLALEAAQAEGSSERVPRALFAALGDPGLRDQSLQIILEASEADMGGQSVFTELLRLGAVDEAIDYWDRLRQSGELGRTVLDLSDLWLDMDRQNRNHPRMLDLYERTGLADYWREHGDPDFCRVTADGSIACE